MTAIKDTLTQRYAAALQSHLAGSDEAALNAAYALGRLAAADGVGVVDIAMLHDEASRAAIASTGSAPTAAMIGKAAQFLFECLAPYEMMLSGYGESNANLLVSNDRLREMQSALETANQELELFSYSVAHDLRAPMRSISGFSSALLEDHSEGLNDEGKRFVLYLRDSAHEMTRLIDDLLSLSRVARGDLVREHVDLSAMAGEVIARLAAGQPERRVRVSIEPGLTVRCDARLVAIMLENLLGNAWKFTSRRTDAAIEFSRTAGGPPAYVVRDNGAGFDMAYADRLFGAFQRLHGPAEFEGTGIGLATVKRVILRHGGRIRAEGAVGQGATFTFTLGNDRAENRGA